MKIQNIRLANGKVGFVVGTFTFDNEGVADITPDEFAESVLLLPDFKKVEVESDSKLVEIGVELDGKMETVEIEEKDLEELIKDAVPVVDESMSHEALDAIADSLIDEGRLEEADYPRKKAKKDKVKAINSVK